jgi:hypothetical protein
MGRLHQFRDQLLQDHRITEDEVGVLRDYLDRDGRLDLEDVKLLVELLGEASDVCPAFDEIFFPALKEVLLADGRVGLDEQYYLLKMLYSDGRIRDSEKAFLGELLTEVKHSTPEFETLCAEALQADPTAWSLSGC